MAQTPPLRPDPDIMGNAEGNARILEHDQQTARDFIAEQDAALATAEAVAEHLTHPPDGMAQVVMTDRELHEYEQWLMATRGAPLFRIPISEEDDLPTYGIGVSDRMRPHPEED